MKDVLDGNAGLKSSDKEYEPRTRHFSLPNRGGITAALDFGHEGRPVDIVFCHANGFNARTYRTILAELGAKLRILAIDLRGHGASTLPADPERWTGYRGYAEDLLAFLEAAVDRPVVLAGHSLGATACLIAAVEEPRQVRSLVLFDPVLLPNELRAAPLWGLPPVQATLRRRENFPDRAAAIVAYRGRGAFAAWSEAGLIDYVTDGFLDAPDGTVTLACRPAWEALTYAIHNYDPTDLLLRLQRPVRILVAETGSTVGLEARQFATALEVIQGTTHFLPMERPQLVRQALLAAGQVTSPSAEPRSNE